MTVMLLMILNQSNCALVMTMLDLIDRLVSNFGDSILNFAVKFSVTFCLFFADKLCLL